MEDPLGCFIDLTASCLDHILYGNYDIRNSDLNHRDANLHDGDPDVHQRNTHGWFLRNWTA